MRFAVVLTQRKKKQDEDQTELLVKEGRHTVFGEVAMEELETMILKNTALGKKQY
jgi:hypothetical protein